MVEAKPFYVYEWFIVDTGEIFYVGKGRGNRVTSMKHRNDYFKRIRAKYKCDYRILKYFDDEQAAFDFEYERGMQLKQIGQAKASLELGNKHKYICVETLNKLKPTQFKKNIVAWNKGKQMSEAYKEQCRARQIGKKQSEETRAKRSQALMCHEVTEETRQKIANARKKSIKRIDLETGEMIAYESMSDLAAELHVSLSIISKLLKTKKPYKGFYIEQA